MYTVFKSTREDMNQGWVWLQNPEFRQRSIIRIENKGKVIYCEALQIDKDFLKFYNQCPRKYIIDPQHSIIINAWYRTLLGNVEPQLEYALKISPDNSFWGKLKANQKHPQVVVRMSTMLALICVGLGLIGVGLGFLSLQLKIIALIAMGIGVLIIVFSAV